MFGMKRVLGVMLLVAAIASFSAWSGERPFSWTNAPAKGDYIAIDMNAYHLSKYLAECELNRPEVVAEIHAAFKEGRYYRKSTKDQKGRPVTITAHVNPQYMFRIVTWRDDTCPKCNGTGKREIPFDQITKNLQANFNCLDCKGKGVIENNSTEKYFILSPEDFAQPTEGRQIMKDRAFAGAPAGADVWVEKLASKNPKDRLDACVWLDANYVRVGTEFQNIMPMLKKARYHEANAKRRIMVWQFWAGKDIPVERNRAFYRVYADTKTGKVTKKGFFPAQ